MNCKLAEEYIMKFFDSELNDVENSYLKQHLEICERCRREFDTMKEIFDSLSQTMVVEPPEDFEKKVMARINSMEMTDRRIAENSFAFLYAGIALMVLTASVTVYEFLRYVDISQLVMRFETVSGFMSMLFGAIRNFIVLVSGIQKGLYHAAVAVADSFYHVFSISAGILLIVYGVFTSRRVKANNGGAR